MGRVRATRVLRGQSGPKFFRIRRYGRARPQVPYRQHLPNPRVTAHSRPLKPTCFDILPRPHSVTPLLATLTKNRGGGGEVPNLLIETNRAITPPFTLIPRSPCQACWSPGSHPGGTTGCRRGAPIEILWSPRTGPLWFAPEEHAAPNSLTVRHSLPIPGASLQPPRQTTLSWPALTFSGLPPSIPLSISRIRPVVGAGSAAARIFREDEWPSRWA
jgi:hypothetical protein